MSLNPEVTNSMIEEGNEYLHKHQIIELFEDLCTLLSYERPADPKKYLVAELRRRQETGPAGHVVFTEQELRNVFTLFDLRQEGNLNRSQCKEALKTIAHSVQQHSRVEALKVPELVDVLNFRNLAYQLLQNS